MIADTLLKLQSFTFRLHLNCLYKSFIDRSFHRSDLFLTQSVEKLLPLALGKSTVILQNETDKEIDETVGHIDDLFETLFRFVVGGDETDFSGQLFVDRLQDKAIEYYTQPLDVSNPLSPSKIVTNPEKLFQIILSKAADADNTDTQHPLFLRS